MVPNQLFGGSENFYGLCEAAKIYCIQNDPPLSNGYIDILHVETGIFGVVCCRCFLLLICFLHFQGIQNTSLSHVFPLLAFLRFLPISTPPILLRYKVEYAQHHSPCLQ